MDLDFVRPYKSITDSVCSGPVENFIVLSGENGSGKSQLLEAIEAGHITVDGNHPSETYQIRKFVLGQLIAPNEGPQGLNVFRGQATHFFQAVRDVKTNLSTEAPLQSQVNPDWFETELRERVINSGLLTHEQLLELLSRCPKRLAEFDVDDVRRHLPYLFGPRRDPFQLSLSDLFLRYHANLINNQFEQWLAENGKSTRSPLSDIDFVNQFGPPPWQLLDQTLSLIGLPYSFVPPEGTEDSLQYQVFLKHTDGTEVTTDLLSSGEKTLLAVAMSLYTGTELTAHVRLPQVLLLDETDASLHPSMVSVLLSTIRDTFVDRHNVRVILTTHSPTTVALAPEESLYTMSRREQPRLRRAKDRDEALRSLTVGLATLSVSFDNRRTVFVESEYDQEALQELYLILKPHMASDRSLDLIASGRGGQGNSAAVQYLVKRLRDAGNTTVWGILDRDRRQGAAEGLVFNPERYSLENLVLDPLGLGAFLLRERIFDSEQLGLAPGMRHFALTGADGQKIVDAVSALSPEMPGDSSKKVDYLGGFALDVPGGYLDTPGHDLMNSVLDAIPQLRPFGRGLPRQLIARGLADYPDFIPSSAMRVFLEIASA